MKLDKLVLKKAVKEVLKEIDSPAKTPEDVAGDEMLAQAMGDDMMAFIEDLPPDEKAYLLDMFLDTLVKQYPELQDMQRG